MLKSARLQTDQALSLIYNALGQGGEPIETEPGVYYCPHFNLGNEIQNEKDEYFEFEDYSLSPYGVCDNLEQIKEKYAKWLNSPDFDFCVSLTPVEASSQPRDGGWRWSKWGEYIGTQNPCREYLHDEPEIELIYCFHIYRLLD
jgi:hypothetical protein